MSDFLSHLREVEIPGRLRALYCLIFLATLIHALATEGALKCCPPGYVDLFTFVQCGQAAAIWTGAAIAFVEVTTYMVFLVPKAYNKIKDEGKDEGRAEGVEDTLDAMREAGVDEETLRRVEAIARRARRNGK